MDSFVLGLEGEYDEIEDLRLVTSCALVFAILPDVSGQPQTFSFLGRTDWYYAVYWCPGTGEWEFIYPGAPFGDHWRYGETLADYPLHPSEAAGVWLYSDHLSSWGPHVWFAHDVLP